MFWVSNTMAEDTLERNKISHNCVTAKSGWSVASFFICDNTLVQKIIGHLVPKIFFQLLYDVFSIHLNYFANKSSAVTVA